MPKPILEIHGSLDAFLDAAARLIVDRISRAIRSQGRCRLALTGGRTPIGIHRRILRPDLAGQVAWDRVEVYFGDERCVPPDHLDSNYRMARETLLDHLPIPPEQVHRMKGELEPADAARLYDAELGGDPLDVVLLGMGGDGHVASLFPETDELVHPPARVISTISPLGPRDRVTLSLDLINQSGCVLLLVEGARKAARMAEVLAEVHADRPRLPAARVRPPMGELRYLVDEEAATHIAPEIRRALCAAPGPAPGEENIDVK